MIGRQQPQEDVAMRLRSILGACAAVQLLGLGSAAALACPQHLAAPMQPGVVTVTPAAFEAQAAQMIVSASAMFRQMSAEMNAMQAQMAAFFQAPMMQPGPAIPAVFGPGMPFGMAPGKGTIISVSITGNGLHRPGPWRTPDRARGGTWQRVMAHAVGPLDAPPPVPASYEAPRR